MLSMDRRRKRHAAKQQSNTKLLSVSDTVSDSSPISQLSFPEPLTQLDHALQESTQIPQYPFTPLPSTSEKFAGPITSPGITEMVSPTTTPPENQQLTEVETGILPATPTAGKETTKSLREPVVIRGSGKKSPGTLLPPPKAPGKRLRLQLTVSGLLLFILLGVLMAVLPLGNDGHAAIGLDALFHPQTNLVKSKNNSTGLLDAQAATATAVTQDGYDAGSRSYAGVTSGPANSSGSGSPSNGGALSRFFYGQCTYWANMRYQQLTGHYIPWLGNAYQWAYAASGAGWIVSSKPNPNGPSILVLQPYVQGAGAYGHVAIVESINGDGSVVTSNWNWAGSWARTTYVTFHPGGGVSFVWYPG